MTKFNDCVAVVTGAGSGIGRQLAYQLADAGAHLAISDINPDTLEESREAVATRGVKVDAMVLDVADQQAVYDYARRIENDFGKVNLVINNAGVALGSGSLWENSVEDFRWVMDVNFYGVLSGTMAFLPILQRAEWGHIVNISSLFGLVSVPTQAAYNASKFAVRGMTDALRQELEAANSSVSCTTVHPGGIATNIARSARWVDDGTAESAAQREAAVEGFDTVARTTPESAAKQILRAVIKNKRRLLIGMDAKLVDLLQRLLPTGYAKILRKFMGDADPLARQQKTNG